MTAEEAEGNSGGWWMGEPKKRRGLRSERPSAAYDKKEQTPLPTRNLSSHPQDYFTAVLSVFQAHLPVHDIASHAKPLDWKARGEESDNTGPLASHRKIDSLDSYSASCNRLRGC